MTDAAVASGTLNAGDVVWLTCGGPSMVIASLSGPNATCKYFHPVAMALMELTVPVICLTKVKPT